MDIFLLETEDGTLLRPASVHGMLWLQTHFEDESWEALASNQVILQNSDIKSLSKDASDAGLNLNFVPALSIAPKF